MISDHNDLSVKGKMLPRYGDRILAAGGTRVQLNLLPDCFSKRVWPSKAPVDLSPFEVSFAK